MRRQAGGALLVAVTMLAAPVRADMPSGARPVRLVFERGQGAEHCPDRAALLRAVTARLGYDPFREDAPRVITASVQPSGGALRGSVRIEDGQGVPGVRYLQAARDDCDELVASMALAISLAIDPEVIFRPRPGPSSPPRASVVAPEIEAARGSELPPPEILAAPLPATLAAPEPARIRWHVGVGGMVVLGAAPALTGGLSVQGGLRVRWFSASVEARVDVPVPKSDGSGGTVRAGLIGGGLVPCFHAGPFAACALALAGALRGSGAGVPLPRSDTTPFVSLGARAGLEIPLASVFSAAVHADLAATLTRTTLELTGADVWTTPPVSAAFGAGLVARFP